MSDLCHFCVYVPQKYNLRVMGEGKDGFTHNVNNQRPLLRLSRNHRISQRTMQIRKRQQRNPTSVSTADCVVISGLCPQV